MVSLRKYLKYLALIVIVIFFGVIVQNSGVLQNYYTLFTQTTYKQQTEPPFSFLSFTIILTIAFVIPGIPGSFLFFLSGRVYGFHKGLTAIIISNQLGGSIGFLGARYLCFKPLQDALKSRSQQETQPQDNEKRLRTGRRSHLCSTLVACFQKYAEGGRVSRLDLNALRKATELEEWRITFLARFVFLPVQLKNYLFGVLPVSFRCFFLMMLLGDLQSACVGVYLGSLSSTLLAEQGAAEVETQETEARRQFERKEKLFSILGFCVALVMSVVASMIAKNAYNKALNEISDKVDLDLSLHLSLESAEHDLQHVPKTRDTEAQANEKAQRNGRVGRHRGSRDNPEEDSDMEKQPLLSQDSCATTVSSKSTSQFSAPSHGTGKTFATG